MKCKSCGHKSTKSFKDNICPNCGEEWMPKEWVWGKNDFKIEEEVGKEIAIALETHGGYRLRTRRGTTYHPNIASVLRSLREIAMVGSISGYDSLMNLLEAEVAAMSKIDEYAELISQEMRKR